MQTNYKIWTSRKFRDAISDSNGNTNCYLRMYPLLSIFTHSHSHSNLKPHILFNRIQSITLNMLLHETLAPHEVYAPWKSAIFKSSYNIVSIDSLTHAHFGLYLYFDESQTLFHVHIHTRTFSVNCAPDSEYSIVPENKISVFRTELIRLVAEQGTRTSAHPPHEPHTVRNVNEYCLDKCVDVLTVWEKCIECGLCETVRTSRHAMGATQ